MKTKSRNKNNIRGFGDIIVVLIAGAVILDAGAVLHVAKDVAESELPDGWSYDQSIMII